MVRRRKHSIGCSQERGATIVLIAVLLIVLVSFVAIGIDGFRGFSSHQEKQFSSDYIALSALYTYLNQPESTTHAERLAAAVARAREVGAENRNTAQANSPHIPAGAQIHLGPGNPSPNAAAVIRSGFWWRESPPTCNISGCPCSEAPPCFRECDNTTGCADPETPTGTPAMLANSISVELRTPEGHGLRTMFASAFGASSLSLSAGGTSAAGAGSSIASAAGRHIVFAVDLSRLTTLDYTSPADSYLPAGRRHPTAREYSYRLTTPSCGPPYTVAAPFTAQWASLGSQQADYQCVTVTRDGTAEAYLVANAANTAAGQPKAHSQMLDALAQALNTFEENAANFGRLDRLSVIGFDESVFRERVFGWNTTTNRAELVRLDNSEIENLRSTILPTRAGRLSRVLFPRPGSASDHPAALRYAHQILSRHPLYNISENSVVLLTTGMTTCERRSSGSTVCDNGNSTPTYSQFQTHGLSLLETYEDVARDLFAEQKITLHSLYFGRTTGAHSVLIKRSPGTGCLSETEMRARGYMSALGGNISAQQAAFESLGTTSPSIYAFGASFLYSSTAVLGGVWGPVRPPCSNPYHSAYFNARCTSETRPPKNNPPGFLANPLDTALYAITDDSIPASVLDGEGRLLCDPAGRSEAIQVRDYMRQILPRPAVMLVN